MPAWRARERLNNILDRDKGASFGLIPAWKARVEEDDDTGTYIDIEISESGRFEAIFVMLGPIRATLSTLWPFYALDGTHTRSRYGLTLLIAVGIDAEDRILPLAWALVPVENEAW
jgi:hypothetical protein